MSYKSDHGLCKAIQIHHTEKNVLIINILGMYHNVPFTLFITHNKKHTMK